MMYACARYSGNQLLPSYSVCKGPILLPMIHEDERMVIRVRRQYYRPAKLLRLIWQRRSLVSVSFMCTYLLDVFWVLMRINLN